MPDVSVLMSVFNGEKYLAESIESILAQTYSKFEFVIVDDGSSDSTRDIVTSYAAADPRIVPVLLKQNVGLAAALNKGLEVAKADYVARMDCDDRALPDRLGMQLQHLKVHDLDLVGSRVYRIDEKGKRFGTKNLPTDPNQIARILPKRNCFIHPSVMAKKSLIESAGGYSEGFLNAQDYDLWLRIFPHCKFGNLSEYLLEYRYHSHKSNEKMDVFKQTYFSVLAALSHLARRYGVDIPSHLFALSGLSEWITHLHQQRMTDDDIKYLQFHTFRYIKNCSTKDSAPVKLRALKSEYLTLQYRLKLYLLSAKARVQAKL